ncbi:MAG: hypothetical protein NT170_02760 [Candidatus Moranbacteria bacterium]|nr:hypothetical protein [Candidatus Moranbacteria bacterium]
MDFNRLEISNENSKPKIVNSIGILLLVVIGPVISYFSAWGWYILTEGYHENAATIIGMAALVINPAIYIFLVIAGWKIYHKRGLKGLAIEILIPFVIGTIIIASLLYSPFVNFFVSLHKNVYTYSAKMGADFIPGKVCYSYDSGKNNSEFQIQLTGKIKIPNKKLDIGSTLGVFDKKSLKNVGGMDLGGGIRIDGRETDQYQFDDKFHDIKIDFLDNGWFFSRLADNSDSSHFFGAVLYESYADQEKNNAEDQNMLSEFSFSKEFGDKVAHTGTPILTLAEPFCTDYSVISK